MATSDVGWSESKILDFLELVLLERNEDCNSDSRDNWRSSEKKNREIVYKIGTYLKKCVWTEIHLTFINFDPIC